MEPGVSGIVAGVVTLSGRPLSQSRPYRLSWHGAFEEDRGRPKGRGAPQIESRLSIFTNRPA